jgi:hypothetical protein
VTENWERESGVGPTLKSALIVLTEVQPGLSAGLFESICESRVMSSLELVMCELRFESALGVFFTRHGVASRPVPFCDPDHSCRLRKAFGTLTAAIDSHGRVMLLTTDCDANHGVTLQGGAKLVATVSLCQRTIATCSTC